VQRDETALEPVSIHKLHWNRYQYTNCTGTGINTQTALEPVSIHKLHWNLYNPQTALEPVSIHKLHWNLYNPQTALEPLSIHKLHWNLYHYTNYTGTCIITQTALEPVSIRKLHIFICKINYIVEYISGTSFGFGGISKTYKKFISAAILQLLTYKERVVQIFECLGPASEI
jgi:hypothetical protein